jgi:hypothetical protein
MDERLRFVARLLEGEKMAPLCVEFGISRKTGCKIFDRYKDCGVQAFSDRSHRAHRQANRLPPPIEATIVRLKREYPSWGAPKIRRPVCVRACPLRAEQAGRVVAATGEIERIKPGHPQQNGRHVRMHLTLTREATKPAAANVLQQQARFDDVLTRYNTDGPHQALGMKVPADLYARSPRVYPGLGELTYPFHDQTIMVTGCGRICFRGRKVNLSHVFAGQSLGVTQVGERIWLVAFMQYDLGYFDDETCRLEPIESSSDRKCYPSARNKLPPIRPERTRGSWLLGLDSNQQPSG